MKKSFKLFAFAILAAIAFSTTSCSKCQSCTLALVNGQVQSTYEVCDDKDAMTVAKDDCNAVADADPNIDCNCKINFSFQ